MNGGAAGGVVGVAPAVMDAIVAAIAAELFTDPADPAGEREGTAIRGVLTAGLDLGLITVAQARLPVPAPEPVGWRVTRPGNGVVLWEHIEPGPLAAGQAWPLPGEPPDPQMRLRGPLLLQTCDLPPLGEWMTVAVGDDGYGSLRAVTTDAGPWPRNWVRE